MISDVRHRPWPLPTSPWVMAMQWHDLLFIHWPIQPEILRPLIPPGLELDTRDGAAWIGIVPFQMRGVRPRVLPEIPGVSAFAELNVRTYVTAGGKPGVYFFSLDAANPLAVRAARLGFHLPYYDAHMESATSGEWLEYTSERTHRLAPPARLRCRYRPTGPVTPSIPGSRDAWLTERYCLYAADWHGTVWRGEIHHRRWPLQPAEVDLQENSMVEPLRLVLPNEPPLLHFAKRLDVVAWLMTVADGSL